MIGRQSLLTNLTTNTLSSDSQQLVHPAPIEFVQELLRPFVNELGDVREELGAERARRQMAEERAAALEAELQTLRDAQEFVENEASPEPTESPQGTLGDADEATESPQPQETTTEEPRSWWRRMFRGG